MKILVEQDGTIQLREVYNPINLKTAEGELFSICMRDGGFEFEYNGQRYSAVNDELKAIRPQLKFDVNQEETNEMLM